MNETEALALAGLGWRLIPIPLGEKRPTLTRWVEQATDEESVIMGWWMMDELNAGLVLGPQPSGQNLIALDIDDREGYSGSEQLATLEEQFEPLPETVVSITGSGGRHILLALPEGMHSPTTVGLCDGPGIDTRGAGGQIVLPPSIHPNGRAYEWEDGCSPWDIEVAAAPEWVLELLAPKIQRPQPIQLRAGAPRPPVLGARELAGHSLNRRLSWDELMSMIGGRFLGQRRVR